MKFPLLLGTAVIACAALAGAASAQPPQTKAGAPSAPERAHYDTPQLAALIINANLDELSGLAGSRRRDDVLWTHNDSGNPNELFAIDREGHLLTTFEVVGET